MSDAEARRAYLKRVKKQFRDLADAIGLPFQAEAHSGTQEAILRIDREGQDDEALRVTARFVDDSDGMEEKLALFWECQGEVTKLLGLGWKDGAPDAGARPERDPPFGAGAAPNTLHSTIGRCVSTMGPPRYKDSFDPGAVVRSNFRKWTAISELGRLRTSTRPRLSSDLGGKADLCYEPEFIEKGSALPQ
jgi:hypothetical protein